MNKMTISSIDVIDKLLFFENKIDKNLEKITKKRIIPRKKVLKIVCF